MRPFFDFDPRFRAALHHGLIHFAPLALGHLFQTNPQVWEGLDEEYIVDPDAEIETLEPEKKIEGLNYDF